MMQLFNLNQMWVTRKINEYINRISNKNEALPINIDLAFMKNDKYNLTINVISTQNENISKFVKIARY